MSRSRRVVGSAAVVDWSAVLNQSTVPFRPDRAAARRALRLDGFPKGDRHGARRTRESVEHLALCCNSAVLCCNRLCCVTTGSAVLKEAVLCCNSAALCCNSLCCVATGCAALQQCCAAMQQCCAATVVRCAAPGCAATEGVVPACDARPSYCTCLQPAVLHRYDSAAPHARAHSVAPRVPIPDMRAQLARHASAELAGRTHVVCVLRLSDPTARGAGAKDAKLYIASIAADDSAAAAAGGGGGGGSNGASFPAGGSAKKSLLALENVIRVRAQSMRHRAHAAAAGRTPREPRQYISSGLADGGGY
jgi:hypothetical protein